jgi:hypothetical protein
MNVTKAIEDFYKIQGDFRHLNSQVAVLIIFVLENPVIQTE